MFSIKIIDDQIAKKTMVSLLLDGEHVESWWLDEPVEVAFKVRELVEEYL